MSDLFGKKVAEILGRIDEKVLKAKLNNALEMLRSGDTEELAKQLGKIDKNELLSKIDQFDEARLKELNISKEELQEKIKDNDLDKLSQLIGEHGDVIVRRIKEIIGG